MKNFNGRSCAVVRNDDSACNPQFVLDVESDIECKSVTKVGDKPLVWLHGEIKSPPFSKEGRFETGVLLRRLQRGENLSLPHSRPMFAIGARCHELRIVDRDDTWRIMYRTDPDAVLIVDVFSKKTRRTPREVIDRCRSRLRRYDEIAQ